MHPDPPSKIKCIFSPCVCAPSVRNSLRKRLLLFTFVTCMFSKRNKFSIHTRSIFYLMSLGSPQSTKCLETTVPKFYLNTKKINYPFYHSARSLVISSNVVFIHFLSFWRVCPFCMRIGPTCPYTPPPLKNFQFALPTLTCDMNNFLPVIFKSCYQEV